MAKGKGEATQEAHMHLASRDARLRRVIDEVGPVVLPRDPSKSAFETLMRSIVYQQLAGKAASTIHGRVLALFPDGRAHPEALVGLRDAELRGAGLSRNKLLALRDLADKVMDGTVPSIQTMGRMTDDAIVEQLVKVRGIGRWSAEMLLIFRLERPDVLPVHDFGVRYGFQLAYGKRALPTPADLTRAGEKWRPFRTAASWYLWRAVDLHRRKNTEAKAPAPKSAKKTTKRALKRGRRVRARGRRIAAGPSRRGEPQRA
ncbi:MAG: DNA-3-methyladenine glycosylase family protein [Polyangiaceae bacterium]